MSHLQSSLETEKKSADYQPISSWWKLREQAHGFRPGPCGPADTMPPQFYQACSPLPHWQPQASSRKAEPDLQNFLLGWQSPQEDPKEWKYLCSFSKVMNSPRRYEQEGGRRPVLYSSGDLLHRKADLPSPPPTHMHPKWSDSWSEKSFCL